MESFLKIVIGSNFFSLSELGNLEKGDVVITSHLTGNPAILLWNNNIAAYGEIVIIDKYLGFRMTSFEVKIESISPVILKEKLIDIIKADVILSVKQISFDELLEIKENSVIHFGDNIDELKSSLAIGEDIIANGKICVIGENFGMEIIETKFPEDMNINEYPYKSTGNVIKKDRNDHRTKLYDFRRPDRFSMLQLDNLMKIHERLIDNIIFNSNLLKNDLKARIKTVDQLAFYELYDSMKKFKIDKLKFNDGLYKAPFGNLIELKSAENKLSDEVRKWVNRLTEDIKDYSFYLLLLYSKENPFTEKNIFEVSFKKAWEIVTHAEPEFSNKNLDFENASKIIPQNDMICIVEIEFEYESKKGSVTIVYPYITIEHVLTKLSKRIF
jgi:flagellar motor switch/type III secretory pathway protein FliN